MDGLIQDLTAHDVTAQSLTLQPQSEQLPTIEPCLTGAPASKASFDLTRLACAAAPEVERVFARIDATSQDINPPLARAAAHHLQRRGKAIRATLAMSAGDSLGMPKSAAIAWAAACELLHGASLVHDDLSDRDAIRRGQAAVWAAFGPDVALCLGDHLLGQAFALGAEAEAASHARPGRLVALLAQAVSQTASGQAQDLATNASDMTPECYLAIARAKTGPLLSLSFLGPLSTSHGTPAAEAAIRFASEHVGILYQVLNDAQNLAEAEPSDLARRRPNLFACLHGDPDTGSVALTRAAILQGRALKMGLALVSHHQSQAVAVISAAPAPIQRLVIGLTQHLALKITAMLTHLGQSSHLST